ncbi:MAG: aminopeptidase [Candidatus Bathyarchaeia archaeon]|jgi:leucyl aminopeptidase (aminopeptidase T)
MSTLYEYEIGKSADILCRELFKLKPGETFAITADTESDMRVVEAVARVAFAVGAKPLVMRVASPLGVGKAADPMLPVKALTAALKESDAWVEFNNQWLLYSTPYEIATKENKNLRYLCLVGMSTDMMTRCLGRIDYPTLKTFQDKITDMTKRAKHMKLTTPAGTNVEFDNDPKRPMISEVGYADTPGSHMLAGQIGWSPRFETINGIIAFDGSIVPPIGLVKEPVKLHVEKGKIVKVEGGKDALDYEAWLRSFNDPNMFSMAHACYGFNPGAKLTGNILEDERVWCCTEWGIGYVGPMLAPPDGISAASHSDGICLNTSVWLDGVQITDKGKVIHKDLIELAKKLGKA